MERQRFKPHLTGTCEFVDELKRRTFRSGDAVLHSVTNENFSYKYLKEHGFNNPILFKISEGLDMKIPKFEGWTNLEQCIGGDKIVEVIDVEKQDYCLIPFGDMMRYMRKQNRTKVLNLISLECSDTSLGKLIQPPAVANELDWVCQYWTTKKLGSDIPNCRDMPRVQKYCLVSPKNAYTDFHIDFGGSSVWYHVVKGSKTFYLIRPTLDNMSLYKNWLDSVNRLGTFFADQVDDCYKITLLPGNTLFLPTGWIHAVLTIEDSLVFGGNFLHSLNMEGQLMVYAMETKSKTPERLLYPHFEEIHWRAARGLTRELEVMNSNSIAAPPYLLNGLKAVLACLKQWSSSARTFGSGKEKKISIIKCLNKHIKNAEKLLIILNPPKPERGSTRPRKKRILEDFIDYPTSSARKKKVSCKPKQSLDYVNKNPPNEKWHVQNGGTKVVFRKLKGFQLQNNDNPFPAYLVNKDIPKSEDSQEMEPNLIDFSDNRELSNEESLGSNQPSSSTPVHTFQSFNYPIFLSGAAEKGNIQRFHTISSHNNIKVRLASHTAASFGLVGVSSENEKKTLTTNESLKPVVVHQDDEYIYPSLLLSDDEVQGCKMSSKDKDAPWNPKAKVGAVTPRTDRPSRVGKQKIAVEKGLEEAASVSDPVTQPKDIRKKNIDGNGDLKGFVKPVTSPRISRTPLKGRRRYTTVKQRLSKILKLHRRQR